MIAPSIIMMCKNEEIWIRRILEPLVSIFPNVIVADTGSTDSTLQEIAKVKGVTLLTFDNLSPKEVGLARGELQKKAKSLGASHVFMVDGDELYPSKYLQYIRDNPMPDDAPGGFTNGIECAELPNGEIWFYGVGLNRHAVFSVDSVWHGTYPFESPDSYKPGHPKNHYWVSPDPSYRFYHLHHLTRSSKDHDVYLRVEKKNQFSMKDHPEIRPEKFWLKSQKDYKDE